MNKKIGWLYIILSSLILIISCENLSTNSDEEDKLKPVILKGLVVDQFSSEPVDSAVVRLLNYSPETSVLTNSQGKFNSEIEADHNFEIKVVVFKESFISDSVQVLVVPGRTIEVPTLKLIPTADTPVTSDDAASVILANVSNTSIGVRESGSPETAEIIFEAQDSTGVPVDLNHAVEVKFRIGSSPGGGEFLHPLSATTNNAGQVRTNLFSGTISGAVQVIAEAQVGDKVIRSKPVGVAIHGGLPDSTHFSLAVEKLNFPGYNIYGLIDVITAYVGDKYGNPVKPETAVYFTTTGGIIEGSEETDEKGQASVDLISAAPKPEHPVLGKGFATVTGRTADENESTIEAHALVLFSGVPQISVNPTTVSVPNGGSQFFNYTVQDQNGNPLAEGTSIKVSVTKGDVEENGDIDIQIPDTQSKYWTNFSFSLTDASPDTALSNFVSVNITTSGPNGDAKLNLTGNAN